MPAPSFTFPKNARLRKRAEYAACYGSGKKWHTHNFILRAIYVENSPARFGISVSKKIGNAVRRNHVKRLLREFFRLSCRNLSGWQIVVIAKAGAPALAMADVTAELEPLFHHLEKSVF